MAGKENLIPMSERTAEEQREIATMGGKASGEARRKRKALREQADLLLALPLQDTIKNKLTNKTLAEEIHALTGANKEDIDNQFAMLVVRLVDALNANSTTSVQSYNCLVDAVGEKKTNIDLNGGLQVNFNGESELED